MTKNKLRNKYLSLRKKLATDQLQIISEQICQQLFLNFNLEGKIISLFLPIESQHEINTYLIWEKSLSIRVKVAVPKINLETFEIKNILLESKDQLELNRWGIPEPKKGEIIGDNEFNFVFVPLLAVDKKGNRVGYGKGFYDRFLKKCSSSCKFVGLHHFGLEDQISDVLPTDIRLHGCLTPKELIWFKR